MKIPYVKPSITDLEIKSALDAMRNGWGEKSDLYVKEFEQRFSEVIGTKYAIATSSCTGAIHLGLAGLGVGNNDEVILADINWIATLAPIVHLGAKPILVDIDPFNWCISPEEFERNITKKTKAVIVTHLYGNVAQIEKIKDIAQKYGVYVIEDCAEAIGSTLNGNHVGNFSDFAVFSFHGSKTLTTGEGGIFLTKNENLYNSVLTLSNHGRNPSESRLFWPERIGYKYKMTNINAAIGISQISRISELVDRKRFIFDYYRKALLSSKIELNANYEGVASGYWMVNAVFPIDSNISSEDAISYFRKKDIDARPFFHPISSLGLVECSNRNSNSYDISCRSINLPTFHDITDLELNYVCNTLMDLL